MLTWHDLNRAALRPQQSMFEDIIEACRAAKMSPRKIERLIWSLSSSIPGTPAKASREAQIWKRRSLKAIARSRRNSPSCRKKIDQLSQDIANLIFYGNTSIDPKEFTDLATRYGYKKKP